jgi:hypothetical protein
MKRESGWAAFIPTRRGHTSWLSFVSIGGTWHVHQTKRTLPLANAGAGRALGPSVFAANPGGVGGAGASPAGVVNRVQYARRGRGGGRLRESKCAALILAAKGGQDPRLGRGGARPAAPKS